MDTSYQSQSRKYAESIRADAENEHTANAGNSAVLSTNQLPYFTGKYDPLEHSRMSFFGHVKSDTGNSGVAFSVKQGNEDRVVAVVFTNDTTMHTPKRVNISDIIAQKVTNDEKTENPIDRQRVWIRGSILNGLGLPGSFGGTKTFTDDATRLEALTVLREENPRLSNLVENRHAYVDVFVGDKRSFIQSISLPLAELVPSIQDLTNAQCQSTKVKGNAPIQQHVGSLRCAEALEAAMRIFERSNAIPPMNAEAQISVSRYVSAKQGQANKNDEPPL
jgi:hypothetical protein